jgi:tripartite-type tricarboxylate transporter receptor subunit TctC
MNRGTMFILITGALCGATQLALAQSDKYPSRPIRFIAANAPGGGLDITARSISGKLSTALGQQVIVDNRAGAAGSVASEIVAKSAPDGYTIMVGSIGGLAVNTHLYKNLGYEPLRDHAAITWATSGSNVLVVHPSVPAKTVKDLIALAKAQPGKLNMSSAGLGSSSHLSGVMFTNLAGINTVHIPYKGGGPMAAAVVAGESHWLIAPAASVMGHVKAGRMRALAITSKARSPLLPELPTISETVPGYEFNSWNGFFAPKGTPRPMIKTWYATIQKALASPEVKAQYANQGMVPTGSASPEDFDRFFRADYDRLAKLVKIAGIKPE